MFGANAHLGSTFGIAGNIGCVAIAKGKLRALTRAVDHIHFWRADKLGDKQVARMAIEIKRGADLFDLAGLQNDDLVGKRHGLDLVMGDIDHGGTEFLVQAGDFKAHFNAQSRIKVGERLVKQEGAWFADNRAANRHTLALPA